MGLGTDIYEDTWVYGYWCESNTFLVHMVASSEIIRAVDWKPSEYWYTVSDELLSFAWLIFYLILQNGHICDKALKTYTNVRAMPGDIHHEGWRSRSTQRKCKWKLSGRSILAMIWRNIWTPDDKTMFSYINLFRPNEAQFTDSGLGFMSDAFNTH